MKSGAENIGNHLFQNFVQMFKLRQVVLPLAILLTFAMQANAQLITFSTIKAANHAYDQYSYSTAVSLYEANLSKAKDPQFVLQRIADCYRFLNKPEKVVSYLGQAIGQGAMAPEYYYHYAQALSSLGKYETAQDYYKKYDALQSDDERVAMKLAALSNLSQFFQDSSSCDLVRMPFNSKGKDFSPAYYNEGLVFASTRASQERWIESDFDWDNSKYLDLYMVSKESEKAFFFHEDLNSKYHEGPMAFYNDDRKVVFTRTNFEDKKLKRGDSGVNRLKMYFADYNPDLNKWENIEGFTYNNDNYSVGHPAMSADGNTIIFASDMLGGMGESDLYVSFKQGKWWTAPRNLGSKVNTRGKEMFPYLVGNNLFFASDGRGGLGGLDVFQVLIDDEYIPKKIENLGYPINSQKDDFGFITQPDLKSGYFTSTRVDSLNDEIYYFSRSYPQVTYEVYDLLTNLPIEGASIEVIEQESNASFKRSSDQGGGFDIPLFSNAVWKLDATMTDYVLEEKEVVDISSLDDSEHRIRLYLKPTDPSLQDEIAAIESNTKLQDPRKPRKDSGSNNSIVANEIPKDNTILTQKEQKTKTNLITKSSEDHNNSFDFEKSEDESIVVNSKSEKSWTESGESAHENSSKTSTAITGITPGDLESNSKNQMDFKDKNITLQEDKSVAEADSEIGSSEILATGNSPTENELKTQDSGSENKATASNLTDQNQVFKDTGIEKEEEKDSAIMSTSAGVNHPNSTEISGGSSSDDNHTKQAISSLSPNSTKDLRLDSNGQDFNSIEDDREKELSSAKMLSGAEETNMKKEAMAKNAVANASVLSKTDLNKDEKPRSSMSNLATVKPSLPLSAMGKTVVDLSSNTSTGDSPYMEADASELMEMQFSPIYYGFDKYTLNEEAKTALDKLADLMNLHTTMGIKFISHTDTRGSFEYNQMLSQNRSIEVMEYLVAKGIHHSRIQAISKGEQDLTNECYDGRICSPADHKLNRRTEFHFIGAATL